MARLDTFITTLLQREGEALLLEGGNNIFLVKDGAMDPLVDARRGVLQNEHIQALLKDIAPAQHHDAIANNTPASFTYQCPEATVVVKTAFRDGRVMARIKVSELGAASGEGAPSVAAASQRRRPAADSPIEVMPLSNPGAEYEAPLQTADRAPPPSYASSSAYDPPPTGKPHAETWFEVFLRSRASDLHLTSGSPAMLRIDGDIKPEPLIPTISAGALEQYLKEIMPPRNLVEYQETNDTDFAYEMPGARLRCNVFRDRRGAGAVFRRIPTKILSAKDLNLPAQVTDLGRLKKGLVLVTGPTGSGKSTTLSALVDWVNTNRSDHIITVEDPIEFVHEPKRCLIHQRQVGDHTQSFSRALRAALREDPDIVLVGEMRDLETIEIAITAAETGHLVMSTLHTLDAPETITRIVSAFPPYQQKQVRLQLGSILKAIISQRLVARADGRGRVAACEVMRSTARTRELIEDKDRTKELHDAIAQGSMSYGMQTFDQSLMKLLTSQLITYDEAMRQTTNPDDFALRVSGIGGTSDSSWDGFDNAMARPSPGQAAPAAPQAYSPPPAPSYAPPGAPPGFTSAQPRPAPAPAPGVATMPPGFPRPAAPAPSPFPPPQPRPAPAPAQPAANPNDDFTIERF